MQPTNQHIIMRLGSLNFEPLRETDFAILFKWLNSPHVLEQWGGIESMNDVKVKYTEKINSDWQQAYIVSHDGHRFGYIQSYCAAKAGPEWWPGESEQTFGIDQFIGEVSHLGQGLGTEMVRSFSDWLLTQPNINKVITDPSPKNARAIRCYEKAGFMGVKVMNTPDGEVLLMEKMT